MSSIANPVSSTSSSTAPVSAPTAPTDPLASESTFLTLLVSQLQNQDPSSPADGTQFVTELAQFTTLSQDTESASDLDTIVAALPSLEPAVAAATPATTAASNTTPAINQ